VTSVPCKLPNLIIAGVHKAGTTSLYTYLAKHPQICPSFKKEIGFFAPLMFGKSVSELDAYAQYFNHCGNERFRMEASPSYLYGKEAIASAIKQAIPKAKIIVILRDPTDRLVSFFSRAVSKAALPAGVDFQKYVSTSARKLDSAEHDVYSRGLREGMYIEYVPAWRRIFDRDLKIVFFDDLQQDAFALVKDICAWLELDATCFESKDFTIENKTQQYRSGRLHRYLRGVYSKNEAYWRKHQRLKQRLRNFYNLVNADKSSRLKSIDDEAVRKLRAMYEPYNKELRMFLESISQTSLPRWLD
jgi:hypothetical protein